MATVTVQKETSRGLKETVATGISSADAKALLEQIKRDYRADDVECQFSQDGETLTCGVPETSSFRVTYRIVST